MYVEFNVLNIFFCIIIIIKHIDISIAENIKKNKVIVKKFISLKTKDIIKNKQNKVIHKNSDIMRDLRVFSKPNIKLINKIQILINKKLISFKFILFYKKKINNI